MAYIGQAPTKVPLTSADITDGTIALADIATNQIDETLMKDAFVGDFSDVTVTAADAFLYGDATDSGNTKKDTVQGILDLATGGSNHTGMIGGLRLSYSSTTVLGVATGIARDYADGVNLDLGSAYTKTTGSWAVGSGNGGLDTGSVGNNAGYGVYLIRRSDTGVVDILISLDTTSNGATMTKPTNYDQWRLIGWFRTGDSDDLINFLHFGDTFRLRSGNYWEFNDNTITSNTYETATTTAPAYADVYWHIVTYNASETGDGAGFSIRTGDNYHWGNIAATDQQFYWNHNGSDTYDGMNMFCYSPVDGSRQLDYATVEGAGTSLMKGEILEVNMITRSHP